MDKPIEEQATEMMTRHAGSYDDKEAVKRLLAEADPSTLHFAAARLRGMLEDLAFAITMQAQSVATARSCATLV